MSTGDALLQQIGGRLTEYAAKGFAARFGEIARRVSRHKPIAAVKSGRGRSGAPPSRTT